MSLSVELAPKLSEKEARKLGFFALTSPIATGERAYWADGSLKSADLLELFVAAYPGAVLVRCNISDAKSEVYEVWIEQPIPQPKESQKGLRCIWAGSHYGKNGD